MMLCDDIGQDGEDGDSGEYNLLRFCTLHLHLELIYAGASGPVGAPG